MSIGSHLRGAALWFFSVIIAWIGYFGRVAGAAEPSVRLTRAVRDLGDDDHKIRERATKILWRAGMTAIPLLKQAATSDDPEVSTRATGLLRKVNLGTSPDIPPTEAAALFERYRAGKPAEKPHILGVLLQSLQYQQNNHALVCLWLHEADPAARDRIWSVIADDNSSCGERLVEDGDDAAALLYFRQMARTTNHPFDAFGAAGFFFRAGCLDAEIDRVKQEYQTTPTTAGARFLVAAYRIRGDLDRAWPLAQKSFPAYDVACLAEERRDYLGAVAAIDAMPAEGMHSWARLEWKASLYHHAGDQARCEQTLAAIAPRDLNSAVVVEAFALNDRPDLAMQRILDGVPKSRSVDHEGSVPVALLCYQWRFREAADRVDEREHRSNDSLLTLGSALHRFGAKKEGLALLGEVLERARREKDLTLNLRVVRAFRELGLEDRAVELDLDAQQTFGKDFPLSGTMHAMFPECKGSPQDWWKVMSKVHPEQSPEQRVARLKMFFKGNLPQDDVKAVMAEAMRTTWSMASNRRIWTCDLIRYTLRYGLDDSRLAELAAGSGELDPREEDPWLVLGEEETARGRWVPAAAAYETAWERGMDAIVVDPVLTIQYGRALEKIGRVDEGREMVSRGHRMCFDGSYYYSGRVRRLKEAGLVDDAREEMDLIFRLASINEPAISDVLTARGTTVAETDPLAAAALWNTRLLRMSSNNTYYADATLYFAIPRQIHQWRAQALQQKGDDLGALREWRLCSAFQPCDADAVSGAGKILRKLHQEQEANEIYLKARATLAALCDQFPASAVAHNTLAWLAARSGRDLDLALRHATESTRLEPENPAYLDTLAEVHFAGGDAKGAIDLMRRCIALAPHSSLFPRRLAEFEKNSASPPGK